METVKVSKKKLEQIARQIIYGGRPGSITYMDKGKAIAYMCHDATTPIDYATMIYVMINNLAQDVGMEPITFAEHLVETMKEVEASNAKAVKRVKSRVIEFGSEGLKTGESG